MHVEVTASPIQFHPALFGSKSLIKLPVCASRHKLIIVKLTTTWEFLSKYQLITSDLPLQSKISVNQVQIHRRIWYTKFQHK